MESERFSVSNVKCQGCASNIRNGIGALAGIQEVDVDVASGEVTVTGADLNRADIAAKLADLGYPETTTTA